MEFYCNWCKNSQKFWTKFYQHSKHFRRKFLARDFWILSSNTGFLFLVFSWFCTHSGYLIRFALLKHTKRINVKILLGFLFIILSRFLFRIISEFLLRIPLGFVTCSDISKQIFTDIKILENSAYIILRIPFRFFQDLYKNCVSILLWYLSLKSHWICKINILLSASQLVKNSLPNCPRIIFWIFSGFSFESAKNSTHNWIR